MVNAGEILKLCSYSYTGMEDEFENTLHFKIRNSSIKKLIYSKAYGDQSSFVTKYSPEPDYCKILFSYYTFKGNFRDGKWNNYIKFNLLLLYIIIYYYLFTFIFIYLFIYLLIYY